MTQYGFYFDSSRCTGCKTCVMACKDYNDLGVDMAFRQVYDYEGGSWTAGADGSLTQDVFLYHLSISCNHCANPVCVENCPQASLAKDEATGFVANDPETCIGCGTCAITCPYGAPKVDDAAGIARKCTGCAERVADDKQPICIEACTMRALEFGDIDELKAAHPDAVAAIAPMPADSPTNPNIIVLMAPAAKGAGDTTGFVANELEIV